MAVVRKRLTRKGFVYDVDFTFKGRRHVLSTKTGDSRIAKKIRDDIQGKIARGKFNLDEYEREHVALLRFFEEYFKYAKSFKKESTIYNEEKYAEKFAEFMGNVNLRDLLNARLLDQWRAELSSKVSASTFNIHLRFLHAAFNIAIKWGYLDKNPVAGVQKAKPEKKRLFMTEEEVAKIFSLIEEDLQTLRVHRHLAFLRRFRLFVIFLLSTGLRRQEALQLTYADLDFDHNLIHVKEAKTNQTRILPMNKAARMAALAAGEHMFTSINRDHASRKFGVYVRRAGFHGFKLHSLRHTFATNLVAAGSDIYTVSRLLGHSDIRTSLIYAKANVDVLRRAVNQLDSSSGGRVSVGKILGEKESPSS